MPCPATRRGAFPKACRIGKLAGLESLPDWTGQREAADVRHRDQAKRPEPLLAPFVVVDDFLPADLAQDMRSDLDRHFGNPSGHRSDTHQIWNYWFVPGLYTYLRTQPEKIIEAGRIQQFSRVLRDWSVEVLGLGGITRPYLSLYVGGCRQGLHNDSRNGRFAFVYSLTRIERRTVGGETVILREGDAFRRNLRTANAGTGLCHSIEPRFNRLVVFDDRLVHGVECVSGSMDPADGRCVLHGHIDESGPIVTGDLPVEALRDAIRVAIDPFVAEWSAAIHLYHGPIVFRFTISPQGRVTGARVVLDRVIHEDDGAPDWEQLKVALVEALGSAVFPRARGETNVTLPLTFGGPLKAVQASPAIGSA